MTTDFTVRPARPTDARPLAELRWTFKQEDQEGRPAAPARPLEEAERPASNARKNCWNCRSTPDPSGERPGPGLPAFRPTGLPDRHGRVVAPVAGALTG
ncbi:hypothetical protein [Streptomyces sp. C10]|uniref:hypothetical protein n=1 Tax=Streptomyces sp. C10 TaxID=531941 RepID=UPI00397EA297